MNRTDDALRQLVDRARAYDREAFGRLYDMYYDRIYKYAYYKVRNVTEAEDITAQTFTGALRTITNFKWDGSTFDSWLFRIAANVTVDTYRRNSKAIHEPVEQHFDIASAEDTATQAIDALQGERLQEMVSRLPDEQAKVLVLKFMVGLSNKEVGAAIGKTEGAVKSLQFRALAGLRLLLRGDDYA